MAGVVATSSTSPAPVGAHVKKKRKCSNCGTLGHNRTTCKEPQQPGSAIQLQRRKKSKRQSKGNASTPPQSAPAPRSATVAVPVDGNSGPSPAPEVNSAANVDNREPRPDLVLESSDEDDDPGEAQYHIRNSSERDDDDGDIVDEENHWDLIFKDLDISALQWQEVDPSEDAPRSLDDLKMTPIPNAGPKRQLKQYLEATGSPDGVALVVFRQFFSSEVVKMIVDNTNAYALYTKRDRWKTLHVNEFWTWLSIIMRMMKSKISDRGSYWSNDNDIGDGFIQKTSMSARRFNDIVTCLHFVDVSTVTERQIQQDKMWRLAPFFEVMARKFRQTWTASEHLSVDEALSRARHRHGYIQYMKVSYGVNHRLL